MSFDHRVSHDGAGFFFSRCKEKCQSEAQHEESRENKQGTRTGEFGQQGTERGGGNS